MFDSDSEKNAYPVLCNRNKFTLIYDTAFMFAIFRFTKATYNLSISLAAFCMRYFDVSSLKAHRRPFCLQAASGEFRLTFGLLPKKSFFQGPLGRNFFNISAECVRRELCMDLDTSIAKIVLSPHLT